MRLGLLRGHLYLIQRYCMCMNRMSKEREREVLQCLGADKPIEYAYQDHEALTNVEYIVVRNYARELTKEIISYCEKRFRYGG